MSLEITTVTPKPDELAFRRHIDEGWLQAWAVAQGEQVAYPTMPHFLLLPARGYEADGLLPFHAKSVGKDDWMPEFLEWRIFSENPTYSARATNVRSGEIRVEFAAFRPERFQFVRSLEMETGFALLLRPLERGAWIEANLDNAERLFSSLPSIRGDVPGWRCRMCGWETPLVSQLPDAHWCPGDGTLMRQQEGR